MDGMPVEIVEEHSGDSMKSIISRLGRLQFVGPFMSDETYSSRGHPETLGSSSMRNLVGDVVGGGEQLGASADAVTAVHSTVENPDWVRQTRSRVHSSGCEEETYRGLHPL